MTAPASASLRVGTRGSLLARTQTGMVIDALCALHPAVAIETVVIRTSGDRDRREVTGAFVVELQEALLRGEVDLAVHSMKDLPTARPAGLTIAATPAREAREDAVISPRGGFEMLPAGSRIGTGSLRRSAQLRALRPELEYLPLVGNVDTRLRKLLAGDYDAIVLSVAGMRRLGYPVHEGGFEFEGVRLLVDVQPAERVLPAPGQGALALEGRADDGATQALVEPLGCAATASCVAAERALLGALGGGCRTPIGASAVVEGDRLRLAGVVAAPDGATVVRGEAEGPVAEPEALGRGLAERLIAEGAAAILAGCG